MRSFGGVLNPDIGGSLLLERVVVRLYMHGMRGSGKFKMAGINMAVNNVLPRLRRCFAGKRIGELRDIERSIGNIHVV